jgi:nitroreductase
MTPWEFLYHRASVPAKLLGEPGPSASELEQLLTLAVHVPDHGRLTPWRFIRIAGEARQAFGDRLAALTQSRNPDAEPALIEKDRRRFSHAPLVLAVVARLTPGHKIPEQEQLLSAGCACFSLLLGAEALGYGAQWLTGWPAYDPTVAQCLGLEQHERVIGFVHIGTATEPAVPRPRPDAMALLSDCPSSG